MAKDSGRVQWHQLFGAILVELLKPVGVEIYTEFNLAPSPPIGDILILRPGEGGWTKKQLARLPDGVRQSRARHILLEFKYSESLNLPILLQAIMSYALYCRANELTGKEVAFFVILSRQPRPEVLRHFGYQPTQTAGLYQSDQPTLQEISLLLLNELSVTQYNAFIKCFASQQKQKKAAFAQIRQTPFIETSQELQWLLTGLLNRLLANGGNLMENDVITVEKVKQMGQLLSEAWLNSLPPEKRLAGLPPAERMAGLRPAERMAGLSQAEIEAYLAQLKATNDST